MANKINVISNNILIGFQSNDENKRLKLIKNLKNRITSDGLFCL